MSKAGAPVPERGIARLRKMLETDIALRPKMIQNDLNKIDNMNHQAHLDRIEEESMNGNIQAMAVQKRITMARAA